MALTCGGSCMKMMLFVFNGLFFLGGAALMGIGIWFLVDNSVSERFDFIAVGADNLFRAAAITLIIVGTLIFVIAFFGCCGACRESQCMLCTFVILIVVIFILEIVAIILAVVFKDEIGDSLLKEMTEQVTNDVDKIGTSDNATSLAWHNMQADLMCCGANNYTDYNNNKNFGPGYPMPKTCCKLTNDDWENPQPVDWNNCKTEYTSGAKPENALDLFTIGCYDSLHDWFRHKAGILIGIACAIAVVQILGIVFACCVRNELTRKKEYV